MDGTVDLASEPSSVGGQAEDPMTAFPSEKTNSVIETGESFVETELTDSIVSQTETNESQIENSFEEIHSSPKETFQDILDFAESDSGAISFDLHIDRVDSREKVDLVLGLLKDPKLKFDMSVVRDQLRDGRVKLTSVNAAKLVFILQALGHQGLSLVWEQKVYAK